MKLPTDLVRTLAVAADTGTLDAAATDLDVALLQSASGPGNLELKLDVCC